MQNSVLFIVSLACITAAVMFASLRNTITNQPRWTAITLLLLLAAFPSCLLLRSYLSNPLEKKSTAVIPNDKERQVIAYIANHLNDKNRELKFSYAGVERGPRDEPSSYGNDFSWDDKTRIITAAERKQAEKLITAICTADLPTIQSVVDEYHDRPFALNKVCNLVDHCLINSGSQYIVTMGVFDLQKDELGNESLALQIKPFQQPVVMKWARKIYKNDDGSEHIQWNGFPTSLVTAEGALRFISQEIMSNIKYKIAQSKN